VAVILDTNALSSLAEKDARLVATLRNARRVVVTMISLGEFTYGIRQSRSATELEAWLKRFLMRAEVVTLDMRTIDHYAAVRTESRKAGTPIPANDCWIAALARQHRLPLVSRDERFDSVDQVRRIDW
jgi:predicted nucleic acid-binding protein